MNQDFDIEYTLVEGPTGEAEEVNDGLDILGSFNGSITFNAGVKTNDLTINWSSDQIVEDDEDFIFRVVSNNSPRRVDTDFTDTMDDITENQNDEVLNESSTNDQDYTILNDDVTTFTITVEAGDDNDIIENEGNLTFTVTSSNEVEDAYEVAFDITGTSSAPITLGMNDLTSADDGVVQFAGTVGETETITVTVDDDNLVELDEQLTVTITVPTATTDGAFPFIFNQTGMQPYASNVTNAVITTGSQDGFVRNDDAASISILDIATAVNEQDAGGTAQFTYTVEMTNPVDTDVTIDLSYDTDGIDEQSDITNFPSSVTFSALNDGATGTGTAGAFVETFTVDIVGDIQVEDDEVLSVTLEATGDLSFGDGLVRDVEGGAANAVTVPNDGTEIGTATIANDDAAEFRIVTLASDNADETGGGTVTYTIELIDEDGSTLTSADEEISVDIEFDMSNLNDNSFISDFQSDAFVDGGNGTPNTLTVTETDDTHTFTVTFDPDQETETFSFSFLDDEVVEQAAGETYSVALTVNDETNITDANNADVITNSTASQTFTINEDDSAIITIADNTGDGTVDEGSGGSTNTVTYTISTDIDIEVPFTVSYTIVESAADNALLAASATDITATDASVDVQYDANNGEYPFMGPGPDQLVVADVQFDVETIADDIVELDEDYTVTLDPTLTLPGGAMGYTVADYTNITVATATTGDIGVITNTINNDDDLEVQTFTGESANEEDGHAFSLTLVKAADVDINLEVSDTEVTTGTYGAATAKNAAGDTDRATDDYTIPDFITVAAGQTSPASGTITIEQDDIVERDEAFYWTITGLDGTSIVRDEVITTNPLETAEFEIVNTDEVNFTFEEAESESEENDITFTILADALVDVDYDIEYFVSGTGLTTEADFTDIMTFGATNTAQTFSGSLSEDVTIAIEDDNVVELDEDFTIEFASLASYTTVVDDDGRIANVGGTETGTIVNNDEAIITISSTASLSEGTGLDPQTVTYTINITNPVDAAFDIPYAVLTPAGLGNVKTDDFNGAGIQNEIDGVQSNSGNTSAVISMGLTENGSTETFSGDIFLLVDNNQDALVEPDETMTAELSAVTAPGGRAIFLESSSTPAATTDASTVLVNDDAAVFTVQIDGEAAGDDVSVAETAGTVTYTITSDNAIQDDVSLELNLDLSGVVSTTTDAAQGDYDDTDLDVDGDRQFTFNESTTSNDHVLGIFDDSGDPLVEIDEVIGGSLTDIDLSTYDGLNFGGVADNASAFITIATDGTESADLTIEDDDEALITFTSTTESATEESGSITFTFNLSNDIDVPVDVQWSTTDITTNDNNAFDVAEMDITSVMAGTMAGTETVQTQGDYMITVTIIDDVVVELDETFNVTLESLDGIDITSDAASGTQDALREVIIEGDDVATGTVENDADVTEFYIAETAINANEGDTGDGPQTQTLTLTSDLAIDADITAVIVETGDGFIMTDGSDYTVPGTVTLPAGQTSQTFDLTHVLDEVVERDELVTISLDGITGSGPAFTEYDTYISDDDAVSGDADGKEDEATVTIDNDDQTTFSLTDATLDADGFNEGDDDGSTDQITYTVTSSNEIERYASENYDITYALTFAQGSSEDAAEPNDFVDANADSDSDVSTGVITISDFDAGSTHTVSFEATQENLVELDEGFNFAVTAIDAGLNSDGRMAQFTGGAGSLDFDGEIVDLDEAEVYITTTTGGNTSTITEGDMGTKNIDFDIKLTAPVDGTVLVEFFSDNGDPESDGATTEDSDYVSVTGDVDWTSDGGILPGSESYDNADRLISIQVNGDFKVEADEIVAAFIQDLQIGGDLVGTTLFAEELSIRTAESRAEGIIENDDAVVVIIDDAQTNSLEGDDTGGTSTFFARLVDSDDRTQAASVDRTVSANYNTVNGVAESDNTPMGDNDFISANGTFSFAAGTSQSQTISVTYVPDLKVEEDENFFVQLTTVNVGTSPSTTDTEGRDVTVSAITAEKRGEGLILNDDRPFFSVSTLTNGDEEGLQAVEFEVRLDGDIIAATPGSDVTVDYVITPGTATTADYDDSGLSGTVTIDASDDTGDTTPEFGKIYKETVSVPVFQDLIVEGTEEFTITISNPQESTYSELEGEVAELSATASIADNDKVRLTVDASAASVGEGGTIQYNVTFPETVVEDVTIDYAITSTTAVDSPTGDYDLDETTYTGTHTFSASDASPLAGGSYAVMIPVIDDAIVEGDEIVNFEVTAVTTDLDFEFVGTVSDVDVTITDDDAALLSIADVTVDESAGTATITVTSDQQIDEDVTVQLTIAETGTAADADANGSETVGGNDFVASVETVTISALGLTGSFDVTINDDNVVEGDEVFDISITSVAYTGANPNEDVSIDGTNDAKQVTITDNDIAEISIGDITVNEDDGTVNVPLTVSNQVDVQLTIDHSTVTTGSAAAGDDFTAIAAGTDFIISAGTTAINIPVSINDTDGGLVEGVESFEVQIENLIGIVDHNVSILEDTPTDINVSTVTINDNDQAVITINDISGTETALDGAQTVTISMDAPVDIDLTFDLSTVEGTAVDSDLGSTPDVDDTDYTQISGVEYTILATQTSPSTAVEVSIVNDNLVENDESFSLRLSDLVATDRNVIFSGSGTTLDASVDIADDDASTISIADVSDDESGFMEFDIQITNPIDSDIEITVNTIAGTASTGDDFTEVSGATYTINAGTVNANLNTFPVTIEPDNLVEADETFTLQLSGLTPPTGRDVSFDGLAATLSATGTIQDNDEANITIAPTVTGTEGAGATMAFTISMSNPVDQSVVFNASTSFTGDAEASDLISITDQQVIFNAGDSDDKTVTVNLVNNSIVEGDETFQVVLDDLSVPAGRDVSLNDGTSDVASIISDATITDDDATSISIADLSVNEGDATATITVSSTLEVDEIVTVDIASVDNTALAGTDYISIAGASTVTLAAGTTTSTFDIDLVDGMIVEGEEDFTVNISNVTVDNVDNHNVTDGTLTSSVTITDNDAALLSVSGVTVNEGDGTATVTVATNLEIDENVTVTLTTSDDSAEAGSDYEAESTSVTIPAISFDRGEAIVILDGAIVEGTESFDVTITNAVVANANGHDVTIDATADTDAVTINDNDAALLSVADIGVAEDGGSVNVVLSSNAQIDKDVTVTVVATDGEAIATEDYTIPAGSATITALGMSANINIPILDGNVVEDTEEFTITISSEVVTDDAGHDVSISDGTGAVADDDVATVTISDNDATSISIADISVNEGDGTATVTVSSTLAVDEDVTVDIASVDNTALAGSDYISIAGASTVTLTAGATTSTFDIDLVDGMIVEGTEDFTVDISNVTVANFDDHDVTDGTLSSTVTITDNDAALLSVSGVTVNEGDGTATVTVSTDLEVDEDVTVTLETSDDSAEAGSDYEAESTSVTIPAISFDRGEAIVILDGAIVEGTESFDVTITNAVVANANGHDVTIDATADTDAVTINDNDAALLSVADIGVAEDGGSVNVVLSSNAQIDKDVTVTVVATDGEAIATEDYTIPAGSATITALGMSANINIPILDGNVVEDTEEFTITISSEVVTDDAGHDVSISDGTGAVADDDVATVTISDNDATSISIADISVNEGDGTATVTVSSTLAVDEDVTVDIASVDNTALAGSDYISIAGASTVTLTAGATTSTFDIDLVDGMIVEGTEDFTVDISNVTVANFDDHDVTDGTLSSTVTITDNDAALLSVSGVTVNEGDGTATVTVSTDLEIDEDVSVTLATSDDNALDGSDYTAESTTVTITAGAFNQGEAIAILDGAIVEGTESFNVAISTVVVTNANGHDVTIDGTADADVVTINDDDAAVLTVSANQSVDEGDNTADNVTMDFTVTLDAMVDGPVTLDVESIAGTAELSADYSFSPATLTFDGATLNDTKTVTVSIVENVTVEADETFSMVFDNLVIPTADHDIELNGGVSSITRTGTITNDDAAIISIDDATINEAAGSITLTLTMDNPVDEDITITANTVQGTARNTTDYTRVSGKTYTFVSGDLVPDETVTVTIIDDNLVEAEESFEFQISGLSTSKDVTFTGGGASVSNTITVTDADFADISITDESVDEDGGTVTFTVEMTAPVDESVIVTVNSANGTATAPSDFTAVTNQSVIFPAGNNADKTVTVTIANNSTVEDTETFDMVLSNITVGAGKDVSFLGETATYTGVGTISDDDVAEISIADATVSEDDGTTTLTLSISNPVDEDITVDVSTTDGSAEAGTDFTPLAATPFTFNANTTTAQNFTITLTDDDVVEATEDFEVALSNIGVTGDRQVVFASNNAMITVEDDDQSVVSIATVVATDEGDTGEDNSVTFDISISNAIDDAITVDYETAEGTALSGLDFVQTTGTLSFDGTLANGTQSVTVSLVEDLTVEAATEQFSLMIENLVVTGDRNVILSGNATTLTRNAVINDDDNATVNIADATISEGSSGTTTASFIVSMAGQVDQDVTVNFSVSGNTATISDSDFTVPGTTSVTLSGANATSTVEVAITPDEKVELDESFNVQLTSLNAGGKAVTIDDGAAVGTITNDDQAQITVADVAITEPDTGFPSMTFTFEITNDVDVPITFDYTTADGTATAGSDYQSKNESITFNGSATQNVTKQITIIGDNTVEADENFTLTFSNLNATGRSVNLPAGPATGIIEDNDQAAFTINDVSLEEGTNTTTTFTFTVTLDNDVDQAVSVDYVSSNGETNAQDFTAVSGTLNFVGNAGETMEIEVEVNGDLEVEDDETFTIDLSNVVAGGKDVVLGDDEGIGTIENDDEVPVVVANDYSIAEDAVNGQAVGMVETDKLVTGNESFAITGGNSDGVFAIDNAGMITIDDNTRLDRETNDQYVLSVTVSDGVNTSDPASITIDVIDVNDTAPVISVPSPGLTVSEDAENGSTIGTLTATDADLGPVNSDGEIILEGWAIVGGNEDGVFSIDAGSGTIVVADASQLDHEVTPSYTLSVTVTDGGPERNVSDPQDITITVGDFNDAPTAITFTDEVDENEMPDDIDLISTASVGTTVGTFMTEDQDSGESHTYSLVEGEGDDQNDLFRIDGNRLITTALINLNLAEQFRIRVRSTDGSEASVEQTFTIIIVPDPSAPLTIFNVLTPNNDGANDVWDIPNIATYPNVEVNLSDKNGLEVFRSTGYSTPFDGTRNGEVMQTGTVLYYLIEYNDGSGRVEEGILYIL